MCFKRLVLSVVLFGFISSAASAAEKPNYFGVINQRSINLTAKYWNPILNYISQTSGVPLKLRMAKTAPKTTAMTERGEHAFVYTNHMFTEQRDKIGYRVILRIKTPSINSTIIVQRDSPIKSLQELQAQHVAFPHSNAFVGYWVPMDHLIRSGITVKPSFAGNQEGAMAQVQHGKTVAAAVNKQVLERYARRENMQYRSLWTSEPFLSIPIMAHPDMQQDKVDAVRTAFIEMKDSPKGRQILKASTAVIKSKQELEFIYADDKDYANYKSFYRNTVVKKQSE
ncbi:MAG: phosphate/phosphite/phosphonate ABC transporter substrate-binding protein [Gammaproteobacteria bacterium]|nr:phosphate/phosphite/phosphonate ABC transporter substrate-binding protein [Gammaproteobacteria bacterium]